MLKFAGVFCLFVIMISATVTAQQWSAEQTDVWKGVQAYWDAGTSGNVSAMMEYWDDSYYGWSYNNEAPGVKADITKAMSYWLKKGKEQFHVLTPARIWVNGDFAYVHYYYSQVIEQADGTPMTEKGRWTDILMKKGGKWVLVGDHGGEIDDD
ncbi:MAG: nuclear transport factor 2 family protein [Ignavibacteriales bacterium]|nr:MAG: nuclear transport factor 2 family protein [Ignavibacteriales bacterium]